MNQLDNHLARLASAGFISLRRREPLQPDGHLPSSVTNVSDRPGERPRKHWADAAHHGSTNRQAREADQAAVHDVLTTNAQVEDLDQSYTGATAKAIVPLPLPPAIKARA